MKTIAQTQRSFLARATLPAAPLALVAVPAATASIIYTNPADLTTSSVNDVISFDMGSGGETGSAVLNGSLPGTDATLSFDFPAGDYYNKSLDKPSAGVTAYGSYLSTTNFFATKFQADDPISGLTSGASFANLTNNPGVTGNWTNDGSHGYIGFRFDSGASNFLYGWAQISYNPDKSLTLYDFAYESSGASILAGAGAVSIPEPSTAAAFAGLLAGSAVLFRRRSRLRAGT